MSVAYSEEQMNAYFASIRHPVETFWMVVYEGRPEKLWDTTVKNREKNFAIITEHDGGDLSLPFVHKVNGEVAFRSCDHATARAGHNDLKELIEKYGADWAKHFFKSEPFWE